MEKIEIVGIGKNIQKQRVLDNIHIQLESGKIYGLIGRNGSGKSMLIRVLAGLIRPTEGRILVDGQELSDNRIKSVGLVLENIGLFSDLSAMENLQYLGKINGRIGKEEMKEALLRVGLDPKDKRHIKKYSLGMRQKLVLAQAIMEKPDVLLLDEPTNALDNKSVELLHKLVLEEAKRGAVVVMASHNPLDIQVLCDRVFHMDLGTLVEEGVESGMGR